MRVVRTVVDGRTPNVCLAADGRRLDEGEEPPVPHDTGDPDNLCRCFVEEDGE